MAFFKFRARGHKGDEQSASPAETIDDMRRRARHRLIGATVLVAVGVLGFPLLFDTQPRPIQVDIPVVIPDRNKTKPLGQAAGGRVGEPAAVASAPAAAPPPVSPTASLDAREEIVGSAAPVPDTRAVPRPEVPPPAKAAETAAEKAVEKAPETKATARADDGAKARALLDGKGSSDAAAESGRFVVQVGAFADAEKAREVRARVERAGLKTYTQVVDTKEGQRIRVRIGPYAQRTEADKVAGKIKSLDLPASILAL